MKILLVQPAPFEPGRLGLENVVWMSEPVALTSLAAMAPSHDIKILDMRLEDDRVLSETLISFRPDLVGTTSMTTDCYQAKAILHMAKSTLGDQCFTIVGGHHPTLAPEEFECPSVDALCLGEGEDTFKELIDHLETGGDKKALHRIHGLRYKDKKGAYASTPKRSQAKKLDEFPMPARHLLSARYKKNYFFEMASPMASMATSRGCAFTCNFCAIWEFYDSKVRFLSAKAIVDQLETMPEKYVFFLDDNFLTHKKRLHELCREIKKRKIKKYWATQGRSDFIADNPELMKELKEAGLFMVLSGYETNEDDALKLLRKDNTREKNKRAADIMRNLGLVSTGIFMVRPDYTEEDFDKLFEAVNEMGVAIPLCTILTPLPGTELWRAKQDQLLTKDSRLFDLLHAVLPTKIPRERFYKKFSEFNQATWHSFQKGLWAAIIRRPLFGLRSLPGIIRFAKRARAYRRIIESHESHLRDELGIITSNRPPALARPQALDDRANLVEAR